MCRTVPAAARVRLRRSGCALRSSGGPCIVPIEGQHDAERAAGPGLAFDRHSSAMGSHDEIDNAQAEPATSGLARQALVHLVELAEDSFLLSWGNSDALVFDGENHIGVFPERTKLYSLLPWTVLAGIVQEVEKSSDEGVPVGAEGREIG